MNERSNNEEIQSFGADHHRLKLFVLLARLVAIDEGVASLLGLGGKGLIDPSDHLSFFNDFIAGLRSVREVRPGVYRLTAELVITFSELEPVDASLLDGVGPSGRVNRQMRTVVLDAVGFDPGASEDLASPLPAGGPVGGPSAVTGDSFRLNRARSAHKEKQAVKKAEAEGKGFFVPKPER